MGERRINVSIDLNSFTTETEDLFLLMNNNGTVSEFVAGLFKLFNEQYIFESLKDTRKNNINKDNVKANDIDKISETLSNRLEDVLSSKINENFSILENKVLHVLSDVKSIPRTEYIRVGTSTSPTPAKFNQPERKPISFSDDLSDSHVVNFERKNKGTKPNIAKLKKLKAGG